MKKLILFLFLLGFAGNVFADDVSEFEIEGIKMGDSLLDYMSEEEIKIQLDGLKELLI